MKIFYLALILLLGEGIIIYSFQHFGLNLNEQMLISNTIVASIIFCLFSIELINPIVNLRDETQASIGGIGIRWFFTFIFVAGSIAIIYYSFNHKINDVRSFWIFEATFLLIFTLGLYFSKTVTEKVSNVYHKEKKLRSNLNEIKSLVNDIKYLGQINNTLIDEQQNSLNTLLENFRYLAPSNNDRAEEFELSILSELQILHSALKNSEIQSDINQIIYRCDLLYKQRKQLYSN